jgi:hypothetical protein
VAELARLLGIALAPGAEAPAKVAKRLSHDVSWLSDMDAARVVSGGRYDELRVSLRCHQATRFWLA